MATPTPPASFAPWRSSLQAKWTLAILVVAVLPLLLLGQRVLDIQHAGLFRAEQLLEVAVVDEAAGNVRRSMVEAKMVSGRVVATIEDSSINVDQRTEILQDLVAHSTDVSAIVFFNRERQFVDAIVKKNTTGGIVSGKDFAAPGPGVPGGIRIAGRHVLRFEWAVDMGFVVIEMQSLDDEIDVLSRNRFGDVRLTLIDSSLSVIAGTARAPQHVRELVLDGEVAFSKPLLLTKEVESAETVVTVRALPEQRWALVAERPTREAFVELANARSAFLGIFGAVFVSALLAGVFAARWVTSPIRALMRLVDKYAKREFAAKSEVKTNDELGALGGALERMAEDLSASEEEIRKRARLEANLRRYMPAEAADSATESLELGGSKKRVTVLFADVVAFTGFAERTSPEKSVAFLNELFTLLSEIVFRHQGMVDKFIGDCVMAVFRDDDGVERALAAAEDMHSFVESNLPRWKEAYAFNVELGIGIATGDVLIGNLGSETRMEYTVIGDAVNVAARLEALAAPKQTLTTGDVVKEAAGGGQFEFKSLGEHSLRGKAQAVEVFEVRS